MRSLDAAEPGVAWRHTYKDTVLATKLEWYPEYTITTYEVIGSGFFQSRFFQNTYLFGEVYEMPYTQSTEAFKFVFLENAVKKWFT